ncbi:MAG: HEPN domain-containing protein [Armatimonadota bacterium]
MRPDDLRPGSPQDWLRHARSDLAVAGQPRTPEMLLETLSFHAQQAVEKSIKAVLLLNGVKFPYTHNIAKLITIIINAGIAWPEELNEASRLTEYAVETRYPGSVDSVTDEEYRGTLAIAKKVYAWAERSLAG